MYFQKLFQNVLKETVAAEYLLLLEEVKEERKNIYNEQIKVHEDYLSFIKANVKCGNELDMDELLEEEEEEKQIIEENGVYIDYDIETDLDLNYENNIPLIANYVADYVLSDKEVISRFLTNLRSNVKGKTNQIQNLLLEGGEVFINGILYNNLSKYNSKINVILEEVEQLDKDV